MTKTLLMVAAGVLAALPAWSQQTQQWWERPDLPIPVEELAQWDRYVQNQELGSLATRLTNEQLVRRFSLLYGKQAYLLGIRAHGKTDSGKQILRDAFEELERLSDQRRIVDNQRFRELYRTIITEHDYYHGRFLENEFRSLLALREVIFESDDYMEALDTNVQNQEFGSSDHALTDNQLLRRLSQLYRHQAGLLWAFAEGSTDSGAQTLRSAFVGLESLLSQPGIAEDRRVREFYRSIITEHDNYFGQVLANEYGNVSALHREIFGVQDVIAAQRPLGSPKTVAPPVRPTIPMEENQSVAKLRNWFLEYRREELMRWMRRAETYFPMIEQILEEEGLPDELKYLAVIESGLNPRARSKWRAVGMWQFMSATGRAYGLRSDNWHDDRMDPVLATRAAARHLSDLYYKQYGQDWLVALAGYNCSPRCINRAIRANGGRRDYWSMRRHLPTETQSYIPSFIAAAQIMSNPSEFGFPSNVFSSEVANDGVQVLRSEATVAEFSGIGQAYAYDEVPVTGMLTIKDIAQMVGTTEDVIRHLNPALVRDHLPPARYALRLPVGTASRFVTAFDNLPKDAVRSISRYTIKRGDNPSRIASRYGISPRALMAANGKRVNATIYPGQTLIVPETQQGGTATVDSDAILAVNWGQHVRQPIVLDYTPTPVRLTDPTPVRLTSTTSTQQTTASRTNETSTQRAPVRHVIRRGDTLTKLAKKYGTTILQIRQENGLRSNTIRRGRILRITPGHEVSSIERATASSAASTSTQRPTIRHLVRRGDNLSKLASKYGTTVSKIRQENGLRSNQINRGSTLRITLGQSKTINHVVQRGENLTIIARKYGTTVTRLRSTNNLRGSRIYPGQQLAILR